MKASKGKTSWGWVEIQHMGDYTDHVQTVEFPNGEGFSINIGDRITIDISWDEWTALKKCVKSMEAA